MNTFFYLGKGNNEQPDVNFYMIETELNKTELYDFFSKKTEQYIQEKFTSKGEEVRDEFFEDFTLVIGKKEYDFCLGDHCYPDGFSLLTMDEIKKRKKIKMNHEDLI